MACAGGILAAPAGDWQLAAGDRVDCHENLESDTMTAPLHFSTALREIVDGGQVLTRPIDLATYACDASMYRLEPLAVVRPRTIEQVQRLLAFCRRERVSMTFRTAGTSLSGQAVTDGVLVDLTRDWRQAEVLDQGRRIRVDPGVVGAAVNARLRPFGAKIGPDPASLEACMIGGILANNSSGMCCGVEKNAYHTLDSLVFVLPSGTVIDTATPSADEEFRRAEPALAAGLLELRNEIASQPELQARIRRKYLTKNTTGYSLNALIDFDRPVDIFSHLLVGSEGTLAFIASAVLRTVPDLPVRYTGLLLFPTIRDACAAIVPLREGGAAALEVMDRAAIRSVQGQPGIPSSLSRLPDDAAGLLVEFQAADPALRPSLEEAARGALDGFRLLEPAGFTHVPAEQAAFWRVRQGMFPSVGAARRRGTTVLIEDVAFPVERLAEAVVDLRALLVRHRYDEAIVFGHAKDGNLHFVITQSFGREAEVDRYARLMDGLVELVAGRYDGALKAEHGTGRNMAPFVEAEWGAEAYAMMRRMKTLADPDGVLNPGVVINDDPRAHLAHLKALPEIDDEVDRCIECGYCEHHCPSRELTMTPRGRIVVRREMQRLKETGGERARLAEIAADYVYDAVDTCAADGLCAVSCPVGIDTGALTKRLRSDGHRRISRSVAAAMARNFGLVESAVRAGLRAGRVAEALVGPRALIGLTRACSAVLRRPTLQWLPPMPAPAGRRRPVTNRGEARAVYFPSCVSRTMGRLPGEPRDRSLIDTLVTLSGRAGHQLWVPDEVDGLCCGVPFSSKGYVEAHRIAVNRTIARFWHWSDEGRLPIVIDTSPCTHGLRTCRSALDADNRQRLDRLTLLDSVEFAARTLLPALTIHRRRGRVVLHPVCSVVRMGLTEELERIARACANEVVVPVDAGCCGFAGDRGWLVPELSASATRREAKEVSALTMVDGCYSSSRTCEIGLSRSTGRAYRSHLYLLEWASRGD
jgi:D-lactate dehydrogenase